VRAAVAVAGHELVAQLADRAAVGAVGVALGPDEVFAAAAAGDGDADAAWLSTGAGGSLHASICSPARRRMGSSSVDEGRPCDYVPQQGLSERSVPCFSGLMPTEKTWIVTGAGRGLGVDIAKAALNAGHNVVATGRKPNVVADALGDADNLLVAKLDVTSSDDAKAAVKSAVDRFGGVDVLVNNAASFYAGFFEELTPDQMDRQITTTLIGPMNVTRAVLPLMRKQRSGHVVTISSSAGFAGFEYGTAYAASKFGVDGWMESLAPEIAPFGIHTTVINPGFFRTELLTKESTNYAPATIDDYAERNAAQRVFWEGMNGKQGGDPTKLAQALITITELPQPPFRFVGGADALAQAEEKLAERQRQIDAHRDLSSSLALDDAGT
jgi:NAD(P)-dependent dehydrogenase (short-subunit alcohol dehydrogenase family)